MEPKSSIIFPQLSAEPAEYLSICPLPQEEQSHRKSPTSKPLDRSFEHLLLVDAPCSTVITGRWHYSFLEPQKFASTVSEQLILST